MARNRAIRRSSSRCCPAARGSDASPSTKTTRWRTATGVRSTCSPTDGSCRSWTVPAGCTTGSRTTWRAPSAWRIRSKTRGTGSAWTARCRRPDTRRPRAEPSSTLSTARLENRSSTSPTGPMAGSSRSRPAAATELLGKIEVEQRPEVSRVPHREVPVAVVHQDVRLARPFGHPLDPRDPFLQLVLLVVVAEPLARGLALRLPGLGAASVEPDHREVVGRGGRDRWDRGVEALRHVDADERQVPLLEEGQGLLDVPVLHPRLVAELDGDPVVGQP